MNDTEQESNWHAVTKMPIQRNNRMYKQADADLAVAAAREVFNLGSPRRTCPLKHALPL